MTITITTPLEDAPTMTLEPLVPQLRGAGKATVRVSEMYGPVRQGEGALIGEAMPFLRVAGCNLACSWCDSSYTWRKGYTFVELTADEIVDTLNELRSFGTGMPSRWVSITGGEPTLYNALGEVVAGLARYGVRSIVETNGLRHPNWLNSLSVFVSCSPKLPGSGQDTPSRRARVRKFVAARWQADPAQSRTQYKFVIADLDRDLDALQDYCLDVGILGSRPGVEPPPVYVQPNGYVQPLAKYLTQLEWLQDAAPAWVRVTPQVHRLVHGPDARGV